MSLVTQISDVITAIGTQCKTIMGKIGDLASLSTTAKTNLVAAINEVVASVQGAGATIDDSGTSTSSVWSSDKTNTAINAATAALIDSSPAALDTLNELAAALGDDANFATTTSTALGNRLRVDAAQTLTTGQKSQGRSNLGVYGTDDIGDPATDFVTVFNNALA